MCKASLDNPRAPNANGGDDLDIGGNDHGMGTAHRRTPTGPEAGSGSKGGASACMVCLHTGAELTVTELTPELNRLLGDTITLTFIETPGSHIEVIHDLVFIHEHPHLGQVPFATFIGCRATVNKATRRGQMTAEAAIGQVASRVIVGEDPVAALKALIKNVGGMVADDGGLPDAGGTATASDATRENA